jgi:hypothetical protein
VKGCLFGQVEALKTLRNTWKYMAVWLQKRVVATKALAVVTLGWASFAAKIAAICTTVAPSDFRQNPSGAACCTCKCVRIS